MAKDYAKVYRGENVMKRGIATYKDEAIFLSQDTLHRDMETLKGRPVVIKHQNVTPENMEEKAVGYVTETFYNNEAGTFGCKFVIFDDEAKELIKNGYSLSTCYKPTSFGAGGTEINTPYDREVTGLNFTHLALVPDPRYEDAKIYENGVMEMEEETLLNGGAGSGDFDHAGRPGLVGGSEPTESRAKRGFKSKSERKEVKKEESKSTFIPVKGIFQSLKDDYEAGEISAHEVAKELARANLTPYLLDDGEALEKIGVKQSDKKPEQKKLFDEDLNKDKFRYEGKTKIKQITQEEWNNTPKDYKTIIDGKKYIMYLDKDEHATVLGRCEIVKGKKDNAIIEEQERENAMENEKMEIPVSFFDKVIDLICNSKKEKKNEEIEEVIEEKEDMEKEKENKCKKNEVVDKRDIIRQIMAIAGKKEASEDVRTIAKLAEKLAYDKDEAEKENSVDDIEYNNDEFFNAMEIAKSLGEADKLPVPETQAKQIERGKEIFG